MSSGTERRFILSPEAELDIEIILADTGEKWGEKQQLIYHAKVNDALEKIKGYPNIRYTRRELSPDYRVCPVGSHSIYYRLKTSSLEVVRILHKRMDPAKHLQDV